MIHSHAGNQGSNLLHLRQSGSSRILFPRSPDRTALLGVSVNTAGGITGGDRFSLDARAGTNSRLTLTSQTAERVYRAKLGETGVVTTRLRADRNSRLDWLPQETIFFNGADFRRRLDVDVAKDATVLIVEPMVFGRIMMGETLNRLSFCDQVRVRRDGELIFADAVKFTGNDIASLSSKFTADGARAAASLIYASADAELFVPKLRELIHETGGASLVRPGLLFARILAPDSFELRRTLVPAIEYLHGKNIPKTWNL